MVQAFEHVSAHVELNGRITPIREIFESLEPAESHDAIDEAVELYRNRANGDTNPLAGAASFATVGSDIIDESGSLRRPFLVLRAAPWKYISYDEDFLTAGKYLTRFMLQVAKPDGRLEDLVRDAQPGPEREDAIALLALLMGLTRTVVHSLISVCTRGYLLLKEDDVQKAISRGLTELRDGDVDHQLTARSAMALVRALKPTLWPLRLGTAFRPYGQGLMVDLAGTSGALFNRLSATSRLTSATQRASKAFELDVQSVFDGTAWEPTPARLVLRGTDLRHKGRVVTDVDAIGENKDVLLFVSVKAWPRRPGIDTGEPVDIRNVLRDTHDKLLEWQGKIDYFRENPRGDSYDFSQASQIIGVLCVPFLPFVMPGPCTEMPLPGLYSVTSIDELQAWLNAGV